METKDLNNKIALTAASLETLYKLKNGEITVNDLQYLNNDNEWIQFRQGNEIVDSVVFRSKPVRTIKANTLYYSSKLKLWYSVKYRHGRYQLQRHGSGPLNEDENVYTGFRDMNPQMLTRTDVAALGAIMEEATWDDLQEVLPPTK